MRKSLSKSIMAGFEFRASSSASVSKARTERLVNEIQRMREKKEVERDFNEDQKTRGELRALERKIFARQRMLAIIAICSLVLGCMINEMCAGHEYDESPLLPEQQAFLEDPNRPARECKTALVTSLKFAQSALTVCLLVMIVARFRLRVLQVSVKQRLEDREVATLKHRKVNKTSETPGTAIVMLVLELVLCAVHTVPGIQPLELRMEALGRKLYYRSESLLCGFMFVRLYHVYFWQEQRVNHLHAYMWARMLVRACVRSSTIARWRHCVSWALELSTTRRDLFRVSVTHLVQPRCTCGILTWKRPICSKITRPSRGRRNLQARTAPLPSRLP